MVIGERKERGFGGAFCTAEEGGEARGVPGCLEFGRVNEGVWEKGEKAGAERGRGTYAFAGDVDEVELRGEGGEGCSCCEGIGQGDGFVGAVEGVSQVYRLTLWLMFLRNVDTTMGNEINRGRTPDFKAD